MTRKELQELVEKAKRTMPYELKSLERDAILFKWKSLDPEFKIPHEPEIYLSMRGGFGFDKVHKKWVIATPTWKFDDLGDFQSFMCKTLSTTDMQEYELKNHEEVIVCGNTPLYRSFEAEREYFSTLKTETDISIRAQLILSRLSKAIVAENDNKAKEINKAFEDIKEGKLLVLTTSLLESIETLDLTDSSDIEKMQYLSSFYQTLEKREANNAGIDLEAIDKRAQISTTEIKQYDDVTTIQYLIMYEMRERFVEEMKENGYNIEIIRNPIFFDEPTKEDIEEGTFEAAEAEAEEPEAAPEENEEVNDNGGNEN